VTTGVSPEGSLFVKRDGGQIVTVIAGDVTEDRSVIVSDRSSMDRSKDTQR